MSGIYCSMAVKLGVGWMSNLQSPLASSQDAPHEMPLAWFQLAQIGSDFQRFSVARAPDGNSSKFIQLVPVDEDLPFVIIRLYKRLSDQAAQLIAKYTFESVLVENYRISTQDSIMVEMIDFLSAELKYSYSSYEAVGLDMQARMGGLNVTV